ncbi:MAG: T9SS C-terminal target domain-containing protein, partial [Candidatus Symbiothrix sp.]|nr:T9SS C-terminal target domain-containing protein [Candidatus Symbiothrix sp.]
MKKIVVLWLLGIPGMLPAQHTLQSELNLPRPGDEIIKQQVEYKDPGRIGENVLWDFGQLSIINDQYKLVYSEPFLIGDSIYLMGKETYRVTDYPDAQLFIGTEHHTRYYYLFQDSLLWALGHENAATVLRYIKPLLSGVFPLAYGEIHADTYSAQGVYSGRVPFENAGKVEIKADAFGMMVLPSGDTLRQVVRTKILRHFSEILPATDGDTVSVNTVLENYQWYSKGYRYPVFETFHSTVSEDTTEIDRF